MSNLRTKNRHETRSKQQYSCPECGQRIVQRWNDGWTKEHDTESEGSCVLDVRLSKNTDNES